MTKLYYILTPYFDTRIARDNETMEYKYCEDTDYSDDIRGRNNWKLAAMEALRGVKSIKSWSTISGEKVNELINKYEFASILKEVQK